MKPRAHLENVRRSVDARDRSDWLSLDRNEWPEPLEPALLEEFRQSIRGRDLTDYPTLTPLYARLAAQLAVEPAQLLLGPGSDALIRSVFEVFVQPGSTVVQLWPSYAMYEIYASMYGAQTRRVEFDADRSLPVEPLLDAITPEVSLVALANPNQPTGTVLTLEQLEQVLDRAAGVVLIDEAYFYFHGESALQLLPRFPNLVITRTFSKAMGMAGARVGFALAQPEMIGWLDRVRPTSEISGLTARAVEFWLAHPSLPWDNAELSRQGQRHLQARLGNRVHPCPANFCLVEVGERDLEIGQALEEHRILVKYGYTLPCLRGMLRVSSGSPAVMERFAQAFLECWNAPRH